MPDIRQRVEEDRGLLKKIQLFVPGFRGYRQREDLRDSDRMLRAQMAQRLGVHRRGLEDARALIMNRYGSKELELLGGAINQFKKVEGEVAHAEMGYSGLVADLQVRQPELDRLYDYDASLIDSITAMATGVEAIKASISAGDPVKAQRDILQVRVVLTGFEDQFKRRMKVITGTEV